MEGPFHLDSFNVWQQIFKRNMVHALSPLLKDLWTELLGKSLVAAVKHLMPVFSRPVLKSHMEYCQEHPEEISKIASVQRKV